MRTTSFRALLLSATALLATGCDSLFFIEAEAEEICKAEPDVAFPAAFPGTTSVQQTLTFPLGDFSDPIPEEADVETELRLKVFEVTANTDLSGIERASVSVRRPGTEDTLLIGEYRRTSAAATQTLRLSGSGAVDLLDLARQEELDFVFEARGSLPTQEWRATLRTCAGIRAKASYFDLVF
ncbi:hypothetical protein [Myxococcus sp. RHSTA-1-4]|uniref:hypothetical protein n=1 Tax=Myxococcus sp. RHSTA-1-4 TaxID=2874601 RepID=UPI001CC17778|nr:hypothetical protein [Myxococcus sp. RHSTA-1-4]MBZ4419316.1 hypothetical protein [Myxococcus sp. RHSTA-1-4]